MHEGRTEAGEARISRPWSVSMWRFIRSTAVSSALACRRVRMVICLIRVRCGQSRHFALSAQETRPDPKPILLDSGVKRMNKSSLSSFVDAHHQFLE